jgi:hypothetical protein
VTPSGKPGGIPLPRGFERQEKEGSENGASLHVYIRAPSGEPGGRAPSLGTTRHITEGS